MQNVSSWGRLSNLPHHVEILRGRDDVAAKIGAAGPGICYGMGRSYGDICLNPEGLLWKTTALDKLISFDPDRGRLVCEAGVLLRDIQSLFVSRGWMLPVTPGTQMVTVGGAIANDVHGKNHHVYGSFGDQLLSFTLQRTNGELIEISREQNADWFAATIGGLGLTGVILSAELQLRPVKGPWLDTETIPFVSLEEFFSLSRCSEEDWEYTVSWIDCLNGASARGIFMRGNHASAGIDVSGLKPSKKKRVPFVPPFSMVNGLSLRPFNTAYFHYNRWKSGPSEVHYEPFFYPLDNLLEWNRMYGPKGFYQYQSVVPMEVGSEAVKEQLKEIARAGDGSFLAVLKTFGDRTSPGMLSFPRPGITLALDFPNRGERTLRLLRRLDAVVGEAGGRIYPAKDARMPVELFESGYPRLNEFLSYRDPGLSSAMSRRLMGY